MLSCIDCVETNMPFKRKTDLSETYWIEVVNVDSQYSLHLQHAPKRMQPYTEFVGLANR